MPLSSFNHKLRTRIVVHGSVIIVRAISSCLVQVMVITMKCCVCFQDEVIDETYGVAVQFDEEEEVLISLKMFLPNLVM